MKAVAPWSCPSCAQARSTPFCPQCGESPPNLRDLSLRALLGRLVHAATSIDGRLLRTLRELLVHAGELTLAHARGRRLAFLAPLPLFLFANVLFFAIQSLTNTNVFSSTLESHMHHQDWSALASALVARRLEVEGVSLESFAVAFDQAVILHAKSLIIAMVVPFAALLPVACRGTRHPFGVHFAFALHLYTMLLLVFCVGVAAAQVAVWSGGAGLASPRFDAVVSVLNLLVCGMYLYAAIGRVYGGRPAVRILAATLLAIAAAAIALGYRFALFVLTLYTT